MKKLLLQSSMLLMPSLFLFCLSSCKKEPYKIKNEPFEVHVKTWYRISPNPNPQPIIINGRTYTTYTYFPGGGTGTATFLGRVTNYFNQLAYGVSPTDPPAGSVSAPVSDIPGYPITGLALPFIQANDFAGLIRDINPPRDINGAIINSVIYNSTGDAIFTSAINSTSTTFAIEGNPSLVGFGGKAIIVGGRGRFKNATGQLDYSGYFNTLNPNDAQYDAEGLISN